jgi:hypothetical protein
MHSRVTWLSICLLVGLSMLVGCARPAPSAAGRLSSTPTTSSAPPTPTAEREPTEEEIAAAEAEIARYPAIVLAQMAAETLDRLARGSDVVVVGRVTARGPVLHRSTSDNWFSWLSQVYEVKTERYLKGSGPESFPLAQTEGYLPNALRPTLARIRAAQKRFSSYYTPISVGSRYLLFLYPPRKEPDLANVDLYGLHVFHPNRFQLSPDGSVIMESPSDPYNVALPPQLSESELIERTERAIAAYGTPSR